MTEWRHVYQDMYMCRCCGVKQRLSQLEVVE